MALDKPALLEKLEEAYFSGVTSIADGDQRVSFATLPEMWEAIQRLRADVRGPERRRPVCGYGVVDKGY